MLDRTSIRVGGELLGSHGVIAQLGLPALAPPPPPKPRGFMATSVPPGGMDGAAPPQGNGSQGRGSGYGTKIACSYLPPSVGVRVCVCVVRP